MKNKLDITDEDIDNLFNNDDDSSLLEDKDEKVDLPEELSIEKDIKPDYIDRPDDNRSEVAKIRNEIKTQNKQIEENIEKDINSIKSLTGLRQVRLYIQKLRSLKDNQKIKQEKTKAIISGALPTHLDNGTECTFHIYKPRDILGDKIHCYCKFCSCEKVFTQSEWDEYCLQYRKWF